MRGKRIGEASVAKQYVHEGARHHATPQYMHALSPMYEPLSYPLWFPAGGRGWSPDTTNNNGQPVSQMWWYRQLLLRMPYMWACGRLLNDWLINMYFRMEDERFSALRQLQTRLAKRRALCEVLNVPADAIWELLCHITIHVLARPNSPPSRLYQHGAHVALAPHPDAQKRQAHRLCAGNPPRRYGLLEMDTGMQNARKAQTRKNDTRIVFARAAPSGQHRISGWVPKLRPHPPV